MKRKLFNSLAVASAVFCVMTVVLWPCSWNKDFPVLHIRESDPSVWVYLEPSCVGIGVQSAKALESDPSLNPTRNDETSEVAGIRYLRDSSHGERTWNVNISLWWFLISAAALPITWLFRKRPFVLADVCKRCGYDLRATPARCPECGAVPKKVG